MASNVTGSGLQGLGTPRQATSSGLALLARLGIAAKGVVYLIVGAAAALAAVGQGGGTTDSHGALVTLYDQPFGTALLGVVALGLTGYALWRFAQAGLDTERKGTDHQGLAQRATYAAVGAGYAGLALGALRLLLGSGGPGRSSDATAQDWTARLLEQPFGVFLVVLAGAVVLGVAGYQLYEAYSAHFRENLNLTESSGGERTWIVRLGRLGHAARGGVFGISGLFLMVAAARQDASNAKGLTGALGELVRQPYGEALLGIVALGLVAYGLYSLAEARYRQIPAE